jgi:hypothetical protein
LPFAPAAIDTPPGGSAPPPHEDLPPEVVEDYQEAQGIVAASPRGAAALLRLAIQKLCMHLGEKGKDLNEDIGHLVKKGLPQQIQRSLDIVRVIGNNAVHPGQIDIRDDPETAQRLFELVNLIVEVMVSQPKRIEELYDRLPEGAKAQIEKRDSP